MRTSKMTKLWSRNRDSIRINFSRASHVEEEFRRRKGQTVNLKNGLVVKTIVDIYTLLLSHGFSRKNYARRRSCGKKVWCQVVVLKDDRPVEGVIKLV